MYRYNKPYVHELKFNINLRTWFVTPPLDALRCLSDELINCNKRLADCTISSAWLPFHHKYRTKDITNQQHNDTDDILNKMLQDFIKNYRSLVTVILLAIRFYYF